MTTNIPAGWALVPPKITEDMHVAAVKVLHRASGVDGLPQRMLDAMLAARPPVDAVPGEPVAEIQIGWRTISIPNQWTPGANVFKDWCTQFFGPDADDDYLLKAVHALIVATPTAPQAVGEPVAKDVYAEIHAEQSKRIGSVLSIKGAERANLSPKAMALLERGADALSLEVRLSRAEKAASIANIPLAAPVAPRADEEPGPSGDMPSDFQEGQWWLKNLDEVAAVGTDDFKRAVAVVRNMMRTMHANANPAPPAPAKGDQS